MKSTLQFVVVCVLCTGVQCAQPEERPQPPNILFYIADDMSPFTESQAIPAFRALEAQGVSFKNAFTNAPSCTPARGILLTGQHLWDLREGGTLFGALPASLPVFPLLLEEAGYWVGHTGKAWGPGSLEAGGWEADKNPVGAAFQNQKIQPPPAGMSAVDYAGNFEVFLDQKPAGSPFFFWYGSYEPHRRFEAGLGVGAGKSLDQAVVPPSLPDHPVIRNDILDYDVEVEHADQHLGKMLRYLEERGELENTLVVVTSDHGMPFPRAKATGLYDDATRIPLIISGPGVFGQARDVSDFVGLMDIGPTLLEYAGLAPPSVMKGQSFLPQLMSTEQGWIDADREHIVLALERHTLARPGHVGYPMRAIRTTDYLLVHNYESDRWPAGDPDYVSIHQGFFGDIDAGPAKDLLMDQRDDPDIRPYFDWATGKRPAMELFDLSTDSAQLTNLAAYPTYASVKDSLYALLNTFLLEARDPRAYGRSPWDANPYYFEDKWEEFPAHDASRWTINEVME